MRPVLIPTTCIDSYQYPMKPYHTNERIFLAQIWSAAITFDKVPTGNYKISRAATTPLS